MTIGNIENTLKTLKTLHPNLDETTLINLLKAGGWEEKTINETLMVFRNWHKLGIVPAPVPLPVTEEEKILPNIIDTSHELLEHNPESSASTVDSHNKNEIPDNLPILKSEDVVNETKKEEKGGETTSPQKDGKIVLVPLSEKDEELLLMAYISLFIIILFLGYKYFSGQP